MDKQTIDNNFTYHPPTPETEEKNRTIRGLANVLAHNINELCPESREKSLAMTNLEQAVMWANESIARQQ